jgi:GNAT superfamily N-acetyltransferase
MPEIEIRPAAAADIAKLAALDHSYTSDYVWQMDIKIEDDHMTANFRLVRLPRSVRVEYPRSVRVTNPQRSGNLVALLEGEPVGYASLTLDIAPDTAWVTDLAVVRRVRRQGIGTSLLLASQEWARQHGARRLVVEMQPKNFPAYTLAQKVGFDLCGYNDRYYTNNDIALFFAKAVR